MDISLKLFDWNNPSGPKWAHVGLTTGELDELFQMLVMFVGHNKNDPHRTVVLGSGFIVGTTDETLVVLSAAHIFSWWVDRVKPPKAHALRGIVGDTEDFRKRLHEVLQGGSVMGAVTPRKGVGGDLYPIVGVSFDPNPRNMDVAVIQLAIPKDTDPFHFRALPIDANPIHKDEIVLMAGFTGGGRELLADDEPFKAGLYLQELTVRAGRVAEYVSQPDGFNSGMWRVNIPSLPGMSGGPLILLRQTELEGYSRTTAGGIISSSRISSPILLDQCDEGDTWVTPIAVALARKVYVNGEGIRLTEAIQRDILATHGDVAVRVDWVPDPVSGVFEAKLRSEQDEDA